jgi:hypothetical protein
MMGKMLSDNLYEYEVVKTTTDKLEEALNGFAEPWGIREIVHIGGRDWVVVAVVQWDSLAEKCDGYGEDIAKWDDSVPA